MRKMKVNSSPYPFPLAFPSFRRISSPCPQPIPAVSSPRARPLSATAVASYCGRSRRRTSASPSVSNHSVVLWRGVSRAHLAVARLDWQHDGTAYGVVGKRNFSGIRATEESDSGDIDFPMIQAMERKIKEQLDADVVIVKDAYGDGRHVSINVVSKAFEGQSLVNRQRMVYKAIWEELQSAVHAVDQMTTKTPTEADAEK